MDEKEREKIIQSVNLTHNILFEGQAPKSQMRGMISHKNFGEEKSFHQMRKIKVMKDSIRRASEIKPTHNDRVVDRVVVLNRRKSPFSSSFSMQSQSMSHIKNNTVPFPGIINQKSLNSFRAEQKAASDAYCPLCPHCNSMDNEDFNTFIYNVKEAKNIIAGSCEFIINSSCLESLDKIFNVTDTEALVLSEEDAMELKKNKEKRVIDIDQLLIDYQCKFNALQQRSIYKIVSSYMNVLIEGKMELERLVSKEFIDSLNNKMIAKGHLFDKQDSKITFDAGIEQLFDGKTKEIICTLYKKKYLLSLKDLKEQNEKAYEASTKRYMVLFIIFLQILAEIAVECRDKALLLYKFFIHFFAEQDKKWLKVFNEMKEKVKYYKSLTKTILQQKKKSIERIEDLNDVFFKNALTRDNMNQHKSVISDLMRLVNEKRETIYSLQSQVSILSHELHLWLYDFDTIKVDPLLRERMKECNISEMLQNVQEELKHKNLKPSIVSLILNSDIFLKLSGQRGYFYDLKKFYVSENRRLSGLLNNKAVRKKHYKALYKELETKHLKTIDSYERDIKSLKDLLLYGKAENSCQTEVDQFKFNALMRNNDLIVTHKRLTQNKLATIVERINYECTKVTPLSMQSLLNLIPDIYGQKISSDNDREKANQPKLPFDEFFCKYMADKFKLKKIIKKHSEETVAAVMRYNKKDLRIGLFKRFLGFEADKVYREVLDIYLILLQNVPVQFDKLFYEKDFMAYLMDTSYCFEIINNRLGFYKMLPALREILIINSNMYELNRKEAVPLTVTQKKEYYLLNRLNEKSLLFFNDLLIEAKSNVEEKHIDAFIANLQDSNMLFGLSKEDCYNVIRANFKVVNDMVQLDSFLEFFVTKTVFRIRVYDFLDFAFTAIYILFEAIEKRIHTIFLEIELKKGLIYFKDFEEIVMKLLKNNELKWKLPSYFTLVCGSDSRDFISKEELISFIMNNRDMLSLLITQKNNCFIPNAVDISKRASVSSIKLTNNKEEG